VVPFLFLICSHNCGKAPEFAAIAGSSLLTTDDTACETVAMISAASGNDASAPAATAAMAGTRLRRALSLRDLILYGLVTIQLTAPMPIYGVLYNTSRAHTVAVVLLSMVAMLLTAISYGRMANAYPSAGSAFSYVGQEIHPTVGYVTGWALTMDYMLIPILSTIWCSKQAGTFFPAIPFPVWVVLFVGLFSGLNLRGIQASARTNMVLAAAMAVVIVAFLVAAIQHLVGSGPHPAGFYIKPIYNPETFTGGALLTGTSVAVLTYLGFDAISTLAEEVHNPRRNILLASVFSCVLIGALSAIQVYFAQLVGPQQLAFENVETAFVQVAGGLGPILGTVVGATVLVATFGSGMGSQFGAARVLFAMGRAGTLPRSFFGVLHPTRRVPSNAVLFVGGVAMLGAFTLNFDLGAELVNFGALLAFMGVNLAALVRYFFRAEQKRFFSNFLPSALGLAVCTLLWLGLSSKAKLLGGVWLVVGVAWGAWRTKGFRRDLVTFEATVEPE
jgi:putrescine importer